MGPGPQPRQQGFQLDIHSQSLRQPCFALLSREVAGKGRLEPGAGTISIELIIEGGHCEMGKPYSGVMLAFLKKGFGRGVPVFNRRILEKLMHDKDGLIS